MDWLGAGALGLSAAGTLFGAKSSKDSQKDALREQQKQNEQTQKFLEKMYEEGRSDVLRYVPQGADAARQAYERAYEIARQAGRTRSSINTQGNMAAQNTLIAGLPQMNAAIMGDEVDLSGLQANAAGSGGPELYNNMRLPENAIPNALAGASADLQDTLDRGYSIDPGATTNRQIVEQAYEAGDITDRDYEWFQKYFKGSGDAGESIYWSTWEPNQALTGDMFPGLNDTNRRRMQGIMNLVQKYKEVQ